MIVPWLRGILGFESTPLTWTLVALNIFIYFMVHSAPSVSDSEPFFNSKNMQTTGVLYWQYLGQSGLPRKEEITLLSIKALQDSSFLMSADQREFIGDPVAISSWQSELKKFRKSLDSKMESKLGINQYSKPDLSWITYQFMHVGLLHLLGNLSLLVIFGCAVEMMLGSLGLLVLYLCGGIAAGIGFLLLGSPSLAPMVGASGSVSALIAFYALAEAKKRVSFFYFFSPFKDYYGWLYLPTLLILPLSFAGDLASYIASSVIPTGVASTAHIGGAIFGCTAGLAWRFLTTRSWRTA